MEGPAQPAASLLPRDPNSPRLIFIAGKRAGHPRSHTRTHWAGPPGPGSRPSRPGHSSPGRGPAVTSAPYRGCRGASPPRPDGGAGIGIWRGGGSPDTPAAGPGGPFSRRGREAGFSPWRRDSAPRLAGCRLHRARGTRSAAPTRTSPGLGIKAPGGVWRRRHPLALALPGAGSRGPARVWTPPARGAGRPDPAASLPTAAARARGAGPGARGEPAAGADSPPARRPPAAAGCPCPQALPREAPPPPAPGGRSSEPAAHRWAIQAAAPPAQRTDWRSPRRDFFLSLLSKFRLHNLKRQALFLPLKPVGNNQRL